MLALKKKIAIAELLMLNHPFAKLELLMPVLPFIRANDMMRQLYSLSA